MSDNAWEPTDLGPRGAALWADITSKWALRPDELSILANACYEADIIEELRAQFKMRDLISTGSMGQDVAAPHVSEIRQHHNTHSALLAKLNLPDEDGGSRTSSSDAGRALVNARWRPRSAG